MGSKGMNKNCPKCRDPLPHDARKWLTLIKIYPIALTPDIPLENLQHVFPLICYVGNLTTITKCVEKMGLNVDTEGFITCFPLHLASQKNVVKYLLEKGANVNQVNHDGMTPLYMSCYVGHLPVVEYLINNGANVNQARYDGRTPLLVSSVEGDLPIVEYLINNGANVNQADYEGITPLYMSSQRGYLSVVKYLINHEADVNQADNDGVTSLAVAIANSHTEIAKFLLSKNANIETTKLFLKEKKEFGMIEILDKLCKEI